MGRYINADDLPVTTVAIRPYAVSEEPYNAEVVFARFVRNAPTADVQAFFTEDEIALINEYKDEVKAVDFKTAILNAVSVALDKVYWQNAFANKPTDSAPTANVREVKRGTWQEKQVFDGNCIEEWQSAKCSVCGRYHTIPYLYYFRDDNYCPYCGADMRGDECRKRI